MPSAWGHFSLLCRQVRPVPSGRRSAVQVQLLIQTLGVGFRQIEQARKSGCAGSVSRRVTSEAQSRSRDGGSICPRSCSWDPRAQPGLR